MEQRHDTTKAPAAVRSAVVGIVLLSTVLAGAKSDTAPARPKGPGVSVRRVVLGGSVDLVVENERLHPITLTLRIGTPGASVQRLVPETATYPPQSRTVAARVSSTDSPYPPRFGFYPRWVKGAMNAKHDDSVAYRLPFEKRTSRMVTQGYGGRVSHKDQDCNAVDFRMEEGATVCAARAGLVVDLQESFEKGGPEEKYRSQANYVSILHDDGTIGDYLHLQKDGVLVELGRRVAAGEAIAKSGNTGYSTRPHLHFGVYSAVDGSRLRSHRMTFTTAEGTVTNPLEGKVYTAR